MKNFFNLKGLSIFWEIFFIFLENIAKTIDNLI